MTELEEQLSESLTIHPEDYSLYIRALWRSHQELDKKFEEVLSCLKTFNENSTKASASIDKLSKDLAEIKTIFIFPTHFARFIKYSAYVLGPIAVGVASIYSLFHNKSLGN